MGQWFGLVVRVASRHAVDPGLILCRDGLYSFGRTNTPALPVGFGGDIVLYKNPHLFMYLFKFTYRSVLTLKRNCMLK
jgi:hypothetical protein